MSKEGNIHINDGMELTVQSTTKVTCNDKIIIFFPGGEREKLDVIPIVTGFGGKNKEREFTTFNRGGSDYVAALFGAALAADVIEIWTDVNGIMSADPRVVENAKTIPELSFDEA